MPVPREAEHRHNGLQIVQKLCNVSSNINNRRQIRNVRSMNWPPMAPVNLKPARPPQRDGKALARGMEDDEYRDSKY